jgi:hypothetical protein
MHEFWFYIKIGFEHVLDLSAYDHILFLFALTLPFTFNSWKKVVLLATIFTLAHCLSLYLSAFNILVMDVGLIEFLIPVTILFTALFNINYAKAGVKDKSIALHVFATTFFGLIHGFGFSNYFKMLMADQENKIGSLLGFATGIEIAQVLIVLIAFCLGHLFQSQLKINQSRYILGTSILVILITIPMLIDTFPW